MNAKFGISVLSFAHGHAGTYCQTMLGFDDVNLVSVWDDDQERGVESANRYGMRYTPFVEEILEDPKVDIVIIASETNRHAEFVEAAASAGKAVLLQKPMALSLDDCSRIIAAVDRNKIFLSVAYQMRHDPSNIKIKEIVASGELGRIGLLRRRHCIPVLFNKGFIEGKTKWHIDPEKNMGMFMDDASHAADFIYWIMGKPTSVISEIDNVLTNVAPDDTGVAVYRFENGAMGILVNSSVTLAGENTTEIYGDQGVIVQNYDDLVSSMVKPLQGATALKMFKRDGITWNDLHMPILENHGERIKAVPRVFLDAYKLDNDPPVSAVDGRVSIEMVLGAYKSSTEGKRILFPL